jgi:plastocyanin
MAIRARSIRRPLPPLTRLTLTALFGSILAFSAEFFLIGALDREIAIVVAVLAAASMLIATGWRWTPLFGGLLLSAIQANNPFLLYNLAHLERFGFFAATVVNAACSLVVVAAGLAATVQNYRGGQRAPGWLGSALLGLAGIVLGAVLAAAGAAIPRPSAAAANNPSPTIELQPATFSVDAITVERGRSVRLVNASPVAHVLANGQWVGGAAAPGREPDAPLLDQIRVSGMGETLDVGPFAAPGTYQFYCPLHPGMNLTVTAQ